MDYCLPCTSPSTLTLKTALPFFSTPIKPTTLRHLSAGARRRPAAASSAAGHCDHGSSSLNTPHEPRSWSGRILTGVFQNDRRFFSEAVTEQLAQLAADRDGAIARRNLSSGSPESCLHRKIAELKELQCRDAVEDVMYMLIIYKFSDIRVSLVPRLSKCIYNGRLEIWPSKDWELESIYSFEILGMIREHITAVVGLRAKASVTDNWARTQIRRFQLSQVYVASILYGYFIKSASLRHQLEMGLAFTHQGLPFGDKTFLSFPELLPHGLKDLVYGPIGNMQSASLFQGCSVRRKEDRNFKSYVMGFDSETLQLCAKLRSKEATNVIEKQSLALFGSKVDPFETDDGLISTSFSSLKRLVLEAIAFGCFLWDTEEYVDTVYKLEKN